MKTIILLSFVFLANITFSQDSKIKFDTILKSYLYEGKYYDLNNLDHIFSGNTFLTFKYRRAKMQLKKAKVAGYFATGFTGIGIAYYLIGIDDPDDFAFQVISLGSVLGTSGIILSLIGNHNKNKVIKSYNNGRHRFLHQRKEIPTLSLSSKGIGLFINF